MSTLGNIPFGTRGSRAPRMQLLPLAKITTSVATVYANCSVINLSFKSFWGRDRSGAASWARVSRVFQKGYFLTWTFLKRKVASIRALGWPCKTKMKHYGLNFCPFRAEFSGIVRIRCLVDGSVFFVFYFMNFLFSLFKRANGTIQKLY